MLRRIRELEEQMECCQDGIDAMEEVLYHLDNRVKRMERAFALMGIIEAERERSRLKNRLRRLDQRWLT